MPKTKPKQKLPTNNGSQPKPEPLVGKPNISSDHSDPSNKAEKESQTKQIDPKILKEQGNAEFKNGHYYPAASLYTEAIEAQRALNKQKIDQDRDLAILYGNRSECYMKLCQYDKALDDAIESVSNDGHWFKVIIYLCI